jgi:hypothetical protein
MSSMGPAEHGVSPPDPHLIHDPKYWRQRAAEARALAELFIDGEAREKMLGVAIFPPHFAFFSSCEGEGAIREARENFGNDYRSRSPSLLSGGCCLAALFGDALVIDSFEAIARHEATVPKKGAKAA